eukprot:12296098-Ditylum_brightwellii.AAC.1
MLVVGTNANVKLGQNLLFELEDPNRYPSRITSPFGTHHCSNERGLAAAHTLAAHSLTSAAT